MIKAIFLSVIVCISGSQLASAKASHSNQFVNITSPEDSARIAELDDFYTELSKTVSEGDFEGYSELYHDDAVIVFGSGKKPVSFPIATALGFWKEGFDNTKAGKAKDNVEFRFSQRIGDGTTAFETGIFIFTSADADDNVKAKFVIHFEMLFVKRDGKWLVIMENQKSEATQDEWDKLK